MSFNVDGIRHTLSTIFHTQGDTEAAEVLDSARAETEQTGEDFGVSHYRLDLRIPAVQFALIDKTPKQLERLEQRIRDKLFKIGADAEQGVLGSVRIVPEMLVGQGAVSIALPTKTDENRIWQPNRLRLFMSHVSRIKTETSALKASLAACGIDGFVAHEDIEPSLEWHRELEFALRSMHAFCALVTDDYNTSKWCDQEVGYALGRGVPVVLVNCGSAAPYGLMGKQQAVKGKLSSAYEREKTVGHIFDVLAKQESLARSLIDGAVDALESAPNFASSKAAIKCVIGLEKNLTEEQIRRLLVAAMENDQIRDAHSVPQQILGLATRASVSLPQDKNEEEAFDDDIPF